MIKMKDETDDRDIQSNLAVQKAAVASHYALYIISRFSVWLKWVIFEF